MCEVQLELPSWIETVFPWNISANYFDEFAQNDPGLCLINNPTVTMNHPIIDFDVNGMCDDIIEAAKEEPCHRAKPLISIVKGVGSGKSRCLEEVRRELLKRPGVLPIAIAYNDIEDYELKWGDDYETAFALMTIARFASVVYGKDLDDMRHHIASNLPRLDSTGLSDIAHSLLEEYLRHVVTRVRSQGIEVNDVVVILDDVIIAESLLELHYNHSMAACPILHSVLLNGNKKIPFNFNATLCISSLKRAPLNYDWSRAMISFDIPSALNVRRIVKVWWKCNEEDENMFLYVAACVNELPRAVEIVGEYIKETCDRKKDAKYIRDLFFYLTCELQSKYSWTKGLSKEIMYSILFTEEMTMDENLEEYVSQSILLNSIERCTMYSDSQIVPETSLVALASMDTDTDTSTLSDLCNEVYEEIVSKIALMAEDRSIQRISFGSVIAKWLYYRWYVASLCGEKVSLGKLLGIDGDYWSLSEKMGDIVTNSAPPDFSDLGINSNVDPVGHMQEVKGIVVNASNPIAVRTATMNDNFDLLLMVYHAEGSVPFRLYISHEVPSHDDRFSIDKYNDPKEEIPKYVKVKSMCDAAKVPFLFCLFTSYPGFFSSREDDCLVVNEYSSKAFFGPIWSIFNAHRM